MLERFRAAFSAFRFVWRIYPLPFAIHVIEQRPLPQHSTLFAVPDDFEGYAPVETPDYRNITRH